MAKYTKKQILNKISFWKKALNEAVAFESEEDQEKEKQEQAAADAGENDDASDGSEEDKDAKIAELEAKIAELEAQLADDEEDDIEADSADVDPALDDETEDSDDEDSEEDDSDEDIDGEDTEDSDEEDEADDEEADDEDTEDSDEEDEADDEEVDESCGKRKAKKIGESKKYAPNTVGAVRQLLEKCDPHDKLAIRANPGRKPCMIIGLGRNIAMNNGVTYLDIAPGKPLSESRRTVRKTLKKRASRRK